MDLPFFRFHPDPLGTGAIVRQAGHCVCCNQDVDYLYVGPSTSIHDLEEKLCPWCIASGEANEKFDVEFSDPQPLEDAGISPDLIEEVTCKTPGYVCWQQPAWEVHSGHPCSFIGDASIKSLQAMTQDEWQAFMESAKLDRDEFEELLGIYRPNSNPGIYHFRCLESGFNRFRMEYA